MDYCEAINALHNLQVFGIRPGLKRMRELLRQLGNPENAIPRYLHIAGTNGKGSVSAMLDSILRAAAVGNALFTSPHLSDHRERYLVRGRMMTEQEFAAYFTRVLDAIRDMTARGWESPTEFEAVTALALLHFAQSKVDIAVMETGLGGELDSTNVIPADIAVITSIGYDHMNVLGGTLREIAAAKAGIIKRGALVISAAQEPEAAVVIEATCREQGARLLTVGRDVFYTAKELHDTGSSFLLQTPQARYDDLFLPLLGRHQLANAACAVAAAQACQLPETAIRAGLAAVRWPGRMELLSRQPLVLIDGAHNQPGMATLAASLREYWPGKRVLGLIGMLADKQREQALAELLPHLAAMIITPPASNRSGDWPFLADYARQQGKSIRVIADNYQAAEQALSDISSGEYDMLLVAGSLYLLASLREYLVERLRH